MSIQFHCDQCDRLLQVPDGSSGKQATCQVCGATMTIPGAPKSAPEASALVPEAGASDPSENPYAAPANLRPPWLPASGFRDPSAITSTKISVSAVISRASRIYAKHFVRLLLAQVVVILAWFASIIVCILAVDALRRAVAGAAIFVLLLLPLVMFVAALSLLLGQIRFTLKLARGEVPSVRELFGALGRVPSYMVATILFALMTNIGYLFCFVPGVYVALTFGCYMFALVDRNDGPIACFESAAEVARGNRLSLLGLYFFSAACFLMVGAAGAIVDPDRNENLAMALTAPAFFFIWPYLLLLHSVAYLMMAGQSVIDPGATDPAEPNPA